MIMNDQRLKSLYIKSLSFKVGLFDESIIMNKNFYKFLIGSFSFTQSKIFDGYIRYFPYTICKLNGNNILLTFLEERDGKRLSTARSLKQQYTTHYPLTQYVPMEVYMVTSIGDIICCIHH